MENVQELGPDAGISETGLKPRSKGSRFRKYAIRTVLILSVIMGWQVLKSGDPTIPPAVTLPDVQEPGALKHTTLSVDVFQRFVSMNSQRMYPRLSREIVQSAIKYSDKYALSPILVLAVAGTESEFYPFALSKKNARGLMQINPEINQALLIRAGIFKEPSDIFDPDRNIEAGCFLLRRFINETHDLNAALDRYLGSDSVPYKAEIHKLMGKVLLFGITEELNRTSRHKVEPVANIQAPREETVESARLQEAGEAPPDKLGFHE